MATLVAPIATGAILVVAACSTSEAGMPRVAEPAANTPGSTKPTSPTSGTSPIVEIDPCTLLSDADRAQIGVKSGEPDNLGNIKSCDWLKSGEFGVGAAIHPTRGFKNANLQGGTAVSVSIGSHQAHKVENLGGGNGACEVFIETSASSMVQVHGTDAARKDTPKACDLAMRVARIIDPRLP